MRNSLKPDHLISHEEMLDQIRGVIEANIDELRRLAHKGEAPVTALVEDLEPIISEGTFWRMADGFIRQALCPHFSPNGRIAVPIPMLRRGTVYVALDKRDLERSG